MTTTRTESAPSPRAEWTGLQAYGLAAFCLLLGVCLGYLFRGSSAANMAAADSQATSASMRQEPSPDQQKAMLDTAAAPLLSKLSSSPGDFDTLTQLGNLYYDGKAFAAAITYYDRALQVHPESADVRTDMATAFWYSGDADRAVTEFRKALKTDPNHANALFNLGIVLLHGKGDTKAAIATWEELLRRDPNYSNKQQVQDFINRAKQQKG